MEHFTAVVFQVSDKKTGRLYVIKTLAVRIDKGSADR